jgi:N-formylglutamate deformylase
MPASEPCTLSRGTIPLPVSFPHAGTDIPPSIARRMTPAALRARRHRLAPAAALRLRAGDGRRTLVPRHSRYGST